MEQSIIHLSTFKNSVPTLQQTDTTSINNANKITLFREITVYSENHMQYISTLYR
jgi:hypothetical protein